MIVRSVRLRNVRCFADSGVLRFQPGVNVIAGRNGSGKSTILEAIGYAVFGALPRGGVKEFKRKNVSGQGSIEVEIRGRDGLDYTIRRTLNGSPVWRSADGGTVEEPLRNEILGVPPGRDRAAFFQDVLGVKQNEFLDPFLGSPAERKKVFEQLFGIADYERAYRELAQVETAIDTEWACEDRSQADEKAALDDPETGELAAARRLESALARKETAEAEKQRALRSRQAALEDVRRHETLRSESELARRSVETEKRLLEQARAAALAIRADRDRALADRERVARTARAKRDYDRAEKDRRALERERTERDASERRLQAAVLSSSEARVEREGCSGEYTRQETTLAQERTDLEKRRALAKRTLSALEKEKETSRAALESFRALDCEPSLREASRALSQCRKLLKGRLARATKAEDEAAALLAEKVKLLASTELAKGFESARAARDAVLARVAELGAKEETCRENLALFETGRGVCPIFQVRCDTVKGDARERLQKDLGEAKKAVAAAQKELAAAGRAFEQANDARSRASRLPLLDEQREALVQAARAAREEAAKDPEIASALSAHERALEAAPAAGLATSPESRNEALAIEPLVDGSLSRAAARLEKLAELYSDRRSALEDAQKTAAGKLELARAEDEACSREAARLAKAAKAQEALKARLAQLDRKIAELEAAREQARKALEPHANLGERLEATEKELARNRAARDEHLSKLENASRAAALEKNAEAALAHETALAEALSETENRARAAAALVDPAAFEAARTELDRLSRAHDAAQEAFGRAVTEHEGAARLVSELAARRARLLEKQARCEKIARERAALHSSRQVLRSAGPALAKMFTERVTQAARGIHRDLGGTRDDLRLEWSPSYEIQVVDRSEGAERRRSIEILSGGEQMTAALAVRLALFDVLGKRVGIGIFDEPTNNLDPERRAQLARLLCGLDERYGQIFVVSHDDSFRDHADHVVETFGETMPVSFG